MGRAMVGWETPVYASKTVKRKRVHRETSAEVGAKASPATMARPGSMSTPSGTNPSPAISASLNVAGPPVSNATKGLIPAGVDYAKAAAVLKQRADQEANIRKRFVDATAGITHHSFDSSHHRLREAVRICSYPCLEPDHQKVQRLVRQFLTQDNIASCGRAFGKWPILIGKAFPELEGMELSRMIVALNVFCDMNRRHAIVAGDTHALDFVEYFCGEGNLSKECIKANLPGMAFDIAQAEHHDVLDPHGFRMFVMAQCHVARHGLLWFGTQCSSFVRLCVSQSRRDPDSNFGLGNQECSFVSVGNELMDVSSLLYLLGHMSECMCVLEQPAGSVLPKVAQMNTVLLQTESICCRTYGGSFGCASQKPLHLWSNKTAINCLQKPKPASAGKQLARKDEAGGWTGNKELLQASEVYTRVFGAAVVDMLRQYWQSVGR
jgi:hypothetical protein